MKIITQTKGSAFPDPVVQKNMDLNMALLECYAKELSKVEWFLEKKGADSVDSVVYIN